MRPLSELRPIALRYQRVTQASLSLTLYEGLLEDYARLFPTKVGSRWWREVIRQSLALTTRLDELKSIVPWPTDVGVPADVPVFVGLYPSGEFNAVIARTTHGALMLFDTGMIELVYATARIVAAKFTVTDGETTELPTLDTLGAQNLFERAVEEFDSDGLSTFSEWGPELSSGQAAYANDVFSSTIDFVLAHEVAHLMIGHFELSHPEDTALVRSMYSVGDELEADKWAGLTVGAFPQKRKNLEDPLLGIVAFAFLADVFAHRTNATSGEPGTHPDPRKRLATAIAAGHPDGEAAVLPAATRLWVALRELIGVMYLRPDRESIAELNRFAAAADTEILEALLPRRAKVAPASFVDLRALLEFFRSEDVATASLALLALNYLRQSPVLNVGMAPILGLAYLAFSALHLGDEATESAKQFDKHLVRAVPDLAETLGYVARNVIVAPELDHLAPDS